MNDLEQFLYFLLYRMGFHAHTSQDTIQSSDAFKVPSYVLRAMMMGQVNCKQLFCTSFLYVSLQYHLFYLHFLCVHMFLKSTE